MEPRQGYLLVDGNPDFSSVLPDLTKVRQPRKLQAAEFDQASESHQRFYDLVQKVYFLKLQNGDLNQFNYGDVMSAVEDVMHPVNLNLDTEQLQNL